MKARPEYIHGRTYKLDTGSGELYVTINDDEGKPFEIFATIGRSGGFTASFTEAIGRLISLALREGIDAKKIAKQLVGIRGPRLAFWRAKEIFSVPDAIGKALLIHIGANEEALKTVEEDPSEDGHTDTVVVDDAET